MQLTTRAPGIKPGTLLLTHEFPFRYYSDNSLTAPLNWTYSPQNNSRNLPYMLDYLSVRLKNGVPSLNPDTPVEQNYRSFTFTGSTSRAVVLYFAPPACLRVMDPVYTNATTLPNLPYKLTEAIPLSDPSRIVAAGSSIASPPFQFASQGPLSWCNYFEKAELARQTGDWNLAARLGEEAGQKGLRAGDPSEYMTFIEAYALTGRWDTALSLSRSVFQSNPLLQPGLCSLWTRVRSTTSSSSDTSQKLEELEKTLNCSRLPG